MARIEPVNFPIKGIATNFYLTVLNFNMEDTKATFYYTLTSDPDPSSNAFIADGNLTMTEQEFEAWGADNQYCLEWAANKLGLTLTI